MVFRENTLVPSRFVPNVVTDFGIVILDKSQLLKHILPSFVTVSGITMVVNDPQDLNASISIVLNNGLTGNVTLDNFEQL